MFGIIGDEEVEMEKKKRFFVLMKFVFSKLGDILLELSFWRKR